MNIFYGLKDKLLFVLVGANIWIGISSLLHTGVFDANRTQPLVESDSKEW